MKRWVAWLALACGLLGGRSGPLIAQVAPLAGKQLGDILLMDRTLAIMQREAQQNAADLGPDLFGGAAPTSWDKAISDLFDPARARTAFDAALNGALAASASGELAQAAAFFEAPLGKRLLELELSAREALLDKDIEAAAKQTWADMLADPLPASATRAAMIRDIVAANDLIETNVSAALNGNLAFYQGLAAAGGLGTDMSQDDMLTEVRSQEAQVRADTEDWLYPYLAMAYAPLSDGELKDYVGFSQTKAGKALNGVLFMAFDSLGTAQSRGMGLAAGRLMAGQDI